MTSFRFWLIRLLAGKSCTMVNVRIVDGTVETDAASSAYLSNVYALRSPDGCERCAAMSRASFEAYDEPPKA